MLAGRHSPEPELAGPPARREFRARQLTRDVRSILPAGHKTETRSIQIDFNGGCGCAGALLGSPPNHLDEAELRNGRDVRIRVPRKVDPTNLWSRRMLTRTTDQAEQKNRNDAGE